MPHACCRTLKVVFRTVQKCILFVSVFVDVCSSLLESVAWDKVVRWRYDSLGFMFTTSVHEFTKWTRVLPTLTTCMQGMFLVSNVGCLPPRDIHLCRALLSSCIPLCPCFYCATRSVTNDLNLLLK
jgi:hypothetical protein